MSSGSSWKAKSSLPLKLGDAHLFIHLFQPYLKAGLVYLQGTRQTLALLEFTILSG